MDFAFDVVVFLDLFMERQTSKLDKCFKHLIGKSYEK